MLLLDVAESVASHLKEVADCDLLDVCLFAEDITLFPLPESLLDAALAWVHAGGTEPRVAFYSAEEDLQEESEALQSPKQRTRVRLSWWYRYRRQTTTAQKESHSGILSRDHGEDGISFAGSSQPGQSVRAMLNFTQGDIQPKSIKAWLRKHESKLTVNQLGTETGKKNTNYQRGQRGWSEGRGKNHLHQFVAVGTCLLVDCLAHLPSALLCRGCHPPEVHQPRRSQR